MTLRDYQSTAVDWLVPRMRGCIVAPAGSGKTIIAASAVHARTYAPLGRPWRVGWFANTREQVDQGHKALASLDWGDRQVRVTIECVAAMPDVGKFDIIVIDEGHHVPAETWYRLADNSHANVWGFTATPWHEDEERNATMEEVFKEFHTIERDDVIESGHLALGEVWMHDVDLEDEFADAIDDEVMLEIHARCRRFGPHSVKLCDATTPPEDRPRVIRESIDALKQLAKTLREEDSQQLSKVTFALAKIEEHDKRARWQITQSYVVENQKRNERIRDLTQIEAGVKGQSVLILVGSIDHGHAIGQSLGLAHEVVHSKLPKKRRAAAIESFKSRELRIMIATSLADEGLDVPCASVLILAAGGRSAGKIEQRTGRVLRPYPGKDAGVIHDFLDRGAPLAHAQARARMRTYRKLGYKINT